MLVSREGLTTRGYTNGFVASRRLRRDRPGQARTVPNARADWEDDFSSLADREDRPPLQLPVIKKYTRVVLVRHGESTWNAENRLQGSSNESVLTEKGKRQALSTQQMLDSSHFNQLFFSPLKRAAETADIVWNERTNGKRTSLPSLREIDLYEFQGLIKAEGKAQFGEQYLTWQKEPAKFSLNGRFPVRELWFRASLAWRTILADSVSGATSTTTSTTLVVAHNAVNQALLCSAAGLPPATFRRFIQANGAVSVVDFAPGGHGRPAVATIDRVNQLSALQIKKSDSKAAVVLLVCAPEHCSSVDSRQFGADLGRELAEALQATGAVLSGVRSSQPPGPQAVANAILAAAAARQGTRAGAVQVVADLGSKVRGTDGSGTLSLLQHAEHSDNVDSAWQQSGPVWESIKRKATLAAVTGEGDVSVVVADPLQLGFLLCKAAGLSREAVWHFRFSPGGCTVVDLSQSGASTVRCVNSLSHRGGAEAMPIAPEGGVKASTPSGSAVAAAAGRA